MFVHKFDKTVDGCFEFGSQVTAAANNFLDTDAIKSFWSGFCCQAGELEITPVDELIFSVGTAEKPELYGNQYAVNVEKTGLCVVGDSKKGLINGFMTLLDMIKVKSITPCESVFSIKCGSFKEKPGVANQMAHFCVFPETGLWELEKFIRLCAALKYSHIVIEFWGMLKYDCLKELSWRHAYSKEQIRPLIRLANELGLEVVPMFNHWGHASASRMMHGKHVVLDQNPRLQPLFSDEGWNWNIQNPDTLELLKSVRAELIDLCGEGKYFHLGCDEAYNFEITSDNCSVLTDYLNGISEELACVGRRPVVWGDMLVAGRKTFNPKNRYTASCKSEELEHSILSALSRNIIIADWQYNAKESPVETALIFKNSGFDVAVCPWDSSYGNHSVEPCVDTAVKNDLFGVIHTTWNTLTKGMPEVSLAAFYAWNTSSQPVPVRSYFATNTAKILRCVYPVYGDYEKAGWAKNQIDILTD